MNIHCGNLEKVRVCEVKKLTSLLKRVALLLSQIAAAKPRKQASLIAHFLLTCSSRRPGGTQAYSSNAQPESSSDVELR